MAPPRHRDRGFSRRIQYGLFFGYVGAAMGIVAALALVLVARFDPLAFQGIRGLALDLTVPVSSAFRPIARGGHAVGGQIGDYLGAAAENAALRAQLAAARREVVQARMLAFENARLRRVSRLIDQGTVPIAVGRIVGSDLAGTRRFATLALGSADGVRPGQPVRAADGLVGRIAETGRHASRIVLLSDGGSAVPLRVIRTGAAALAEGRGSGALDIRTTTAGAPPLRRGDLLVTSGTGGVFPPDLPVATVIAANGEVATGRTLADPATLDFAVVLPLAAAPPPSPPHREAALMAPLAARASGPPRSARLWLVPVAATIAGSAVTLLPIVAAAPVLPPVGLMTALGWRLLRPEMWPAWVALPLGLADDLIGGAPLGSAACLWTIAFLGIDLADARPMWRDHWLDWWIAAAAILFVGIGGWALAAFVSGGGAMWPLLPQLLLGILLFPVAQRLCARLDRWRLR